MSKVNKSIGYCVSSSNSVLPRASLFNVYKIFILTDFDYADVVYDQSYKSTFYKKLESIQYNAALAVYTRIFF